MTTGEPLERNQCLKNAAVGCLNYHRCNIFGRIKLYTGACISEKCLWTTSSIFLNAIEDGAERFDVGYKFV